MQHIKKIVLLPLALLVFYLGILAIVQLIIKTNIPKVEELVKETGQVESVTLNRFINLPFFFVTFRDVRVDIDEFTVLEIDKIRVSYSVLALLFKGPESLIRKIKISTIKLDGSLGAVLDLVNQPTPDQKAVDTDWLYSINTRLKIDRFIGDLQVIGEIAAEIQVNDFNAKWRNNQLWMRSNIFMKIKKSNLISYVKSGMTVDLHLTDLKNNMGEGDLQVLGFNLAGVDLIDNAPLPFIISNGLILQLDKSPLSSMMSQTNDLFHFHVEQLFTLSYQRFDEFYLLEHMFDPGIYQGGLDLQIDNQGMRFYTRIDDTNDSRTFLELKARPQNRDFSLKGSAQSKKYGLAKIDLLFEPGNDFPSGTILTRGLDVIPGLGISTKASITADKNKILVRGRDLYLNGGRIGTTAVTIVLEPGGGVSFLAVPWFVNAPVQGYIGNADYELNIGLKNVPGSAVINNIGFDMFNLGRGYYTGGLKIFNEGPKFKITGKLNGYYQGKKLVDVALDLTDETLKLTSVYFPQSELWASLLLDFLHPYKNQTEIRISGRISLNNKYNLPMTGRVVSFIDSKNARVNLTFDKGIALRINTVNNNSRIKIKAKDYSLNTFALPGKVDLDVAIKLGNTVLNDLGLNLVYRYNNRTYQLKLKTGKKIKGHLPLKHFVIAFDDDKVYGKGKLWETRNRLNAKINFVRGGSLKFESSFEKVNGLLSLKNIYIKDFFKDKRNIFFSMNMNFSGDLAFPDYQIHKLSVINSVNSSPFSLTATGINRRPGTVNIASLFLRSPDFSTRLSGKIRFKPQGIQVQSKGLLGLGGVIKIGFNIEYQQGKGGDAVKYSLYDFSMGKEYFSPFKGKVNIKNNVFTFTATSPINGIQGNFINRSKKKWDVQANLSRLQVSSKGGIVNKIFTPNSGISFKADLKLLSFMDDVFKKISGSVKSDLTINGSVRDPKLNGRLLVNDGLMSIVNLNMTIRDLNDTIPVQNSKLLFNKMKVPSSTGVFLFNGYLELSQLLISYVDLTLSPYPGEEAWLNLGMQTPFIKLLGNLYLKKVMVEGPPLHLNLTGEVTARNATIFVGFQVDEPASEEGIIEGIVWNLKVNMGNGVKFGNQFIDTTLSAGQSLLVLGSIGDASLSLKGDVDVSRGVLTFLQQDFTIIEGSTASFTGQPGDPIPYVSIQTRTYTRDPDGGRIEVKLTFEGKLTKLSLKEFSTKNSTLGRNELYALLGFQSLVDSSSGTNQSASAIQNVALGGWNALENTFIFNPIANTLRRTLGLDLVLIRSQALGNIFENTLFGSSTNIDATSIIEGTSLTFGKYLFSNLFVEYELSFERSDLSGLGLEPMHSFGVGLDYQNFFLGWKYGPEDFGSGLDYEHSLDFQYHQKF